MEKNFKDVNGKKWNDSKTFSFKGNSPFGQQIPL